jgi:prepilin-type processing-associated H-X9-DG protein
MKYLAYMNILFGDNHVRTVEIGKKGGMPKLWQIMYLDITIP